jgi:hypothetical protein
MDASSSIIFGGFLGLNVALLFCAVFFARKRPFFLRMGLAYCCIVDFILNIFYLARGLGHEWVTTKLREKVLAWFIIPSLASMVVAWRSSERRKRQVRDQDNSPKVT